MRNVLAVFYYMLSSLGSEIWFILTIVIPFMVVAILSFVLSCTIYGKFIRREIKARKFVRNGVITCETKDLFFAKCIKGLPSLFVQSYLSNTSQHCLMLSEELRPLFKGTKKIMLSLFDLIWSVFFVITVIVSLIEGNELTMMFFCIFAPLPFILANRFMYKYIIYKYDSRARVAYKRLVNTINNDYMSIPSMNIKKEINFDNL